MKIRTRSNYRWELKTKDGLYSLTRNSDSTAEGGVDVRLHFSRKGEYSYGNPKQVAAKDAPADVREAFLEAGLRFFDAASPRHGLRDKTKIDVDPHTATAEKESYTAPEAYAADHPDDLPE